MRTKQGFILHSIGDEQIIMHDGSSSIDFSNVISLSPTAAFLWKEIEGKDFDANLLADTLIQQYEVTSKTAHKDAETLIKDWMQAGIIE